MSPLVNGGFFRFADTLTTTIDSLYSFYSLFHRVLTVPIILWANTLFTWENIFCFVVLLDKTFRVWRIQINEQTNTHINVINKSFNNNKSLYKSIQLLCVCVCSDQILHDLENYVVFNLIECENKLIFSVREISKKKELCHNISLFCEFSKVFFSCQLREYNNF